MAAVARFVDRVARQDADAALIRARGTMWRLDALRQSLCADTPDNAALLAFQARAAVADLEAAIDRLDSRAEA